MGDWSGSSSRLQVQVILDEALRDYSEQTGVDLITHPLAALLQSCDSPESITAVFREQIQALNEIPKKDKAMKPLRNVISRLSVISNSGAASQHLQPVVKALYTGFAIILSSPAKGVIDGDALVDFFESVEHTLNLFHIYTTIQVPSSIINDMLVKLLIELLSTVALITKQITKQGLGRSRKLGEKDVLVVLQRLNRLTHDTVQVTAAQTLQATYGLLHNMRGIMDDGKISVGQGRDTLEIMQQIACDLNVSKRDSLRQDIFKWLSPPDYLKNHHTACELRHRGSGTWFIQGATFAEWQMSEARSSLLWVHGKPGAGKSVFCSTIIEHVDCMRKSGSATAAASIAFFYCDFKEDQKKDLRGLLSSLLAQLSDQSNAYCDMLFKFYSEHANGLRRPSDDALVGCLKDILKLPHQAPVYLIVDALDEFPNASAIPSPRAKVLNLIKELINLKLPNLRICVTSRLETDIMAVLYPLYFRSVSLDSEGEQMEDIVEYIKSVVNENPRNRRWRTEDKQLVIDVLTKKADGMFRWAYCQLVYICGCPPDRIPHALANLPETLDATYQRILGEITNEEWEIAHRLFQFIAVARCPLQVEKFAGLLAFDFKAGPIPKFHEGRRPEDPTDTVLSTCSSLLSVVDVEGSSFIQFSHISVKEYLMSARLAEASDIIPRRYHISLTHAHTLVARACLGILLYLDKDVVTSDNLENWPLAEYAAEHWADHARFEGVSRNVEDGMKLLFDPSKPHLAVCIWIHDPDAPLRERNSLTKWPSPLPGTPLHYAALWGLHSIVDFLITEHSQDVCSGRFTDNATPLHLAAKRGHVTVAGILIEHGADITAQTKDGETPLHLASPSGQVEIAAMLIERGADVTARNKYGKTPLHLALQRGRAEVTGTAIEYGADVVAPKKDGATTSHDPHLQEGQVIVARMLIERGAASADVTARDEDEETPLHLASLSGQVEVVGMLIERGADVTSKNKDGETPLHLASREGKVGVARVLIECGADVTAQNEDEETPLHLATLSGQVEVVGMLIKRGADATSKNKDGETPLHLASREGKVGVARVLIECGADVTAQNEDGETPLHLASLNGQAEIASRLIRCGADVEALNEDEDTSLHLASQNGQVEVARMLIDSGANLQAQNVYGSTPLHLALQRGQMELSGELIERGADVKAQSKKGQTPLHLASLNGQVEVSDMLIERGADVTAQNKYGETPLHLALWKEQAEIAYLLIECGADVEAQNEDGDTSLHLASFMGQAQVARLLIRRGADVMAQNKDQETPLHLSSKQGQLELTGLLVENGADVTAQNKYGETPLHLASREGHSEIIDMLKIGFIYSLLRQMKQCDPGLTMSEPDASSSSLTLIGGS